MKEKEQDNQNLTTVLGGVETLVILDEEKCETVKVRALKLNQAQTYLRLAQAGDESALIELFCGKEKGWADTVLPEYQEKIIETGEQLNRDFMMRYAERAKVRREKIAPGFEEKAMNQLIDRLAPSLEKLLPQAVLPTSKSETSPLPS